MVALIWEGITDPLVGFLANTTKTRWGRYRPYLLFGSIPLGLSFVAMFPPIGLSSAALAIYALASHLLFRTVFTFVNIPYLSLSAQITSDSLTRGYLAAARLFSTAVCGILLAVATLPAVNLMGGGRGGFFGVTLVYALLSAAILTICFFSTRESVQATSRHQVDLSGTMQAIRVNRPFQLVFGATLLASVGYTMCTKALIYYVKYSGGTERSISVALTIFLATGAASVLPWAWLMRPRPNAGCGLPRSRSR